MSVRKVYLGRDDEDILKRVDSLGVPFSQYVRDLIREDIQRGGTTAPAPSLEDIRRVVREELLQVSVSRETAERETKSGSGVTEEEQELLSCSFD